MSIRKRISNKASVIDAIVEKYGTLEEFSRQTGLSYQLILDGLVGSGNYDPELVETLRESGIKVEVTA